MRHGARDRDSEVAVEVEPDGRLRSFDGNFTDDLDSWLLGPLGLDATTRPAEIAELMDWTLRGHLSWCVFLVDID